MDIYGFQMVMKIFEKTPDKKSTRKTSYDIDELEKIDTLDNF